MSALAPYDGISLRTYSHARHALVEALRRAATPRGAIVLVPGFVCRDVLASIHAVGARPRFYDVDTGLRPQGLDGHPVAHAVLAVDYFGIPQDMRPFLELRSRDGTIVIEDNAHGLLGRDEEGQLLGTRGDYGLLSMRKTFHLPDGAALLDNRDGAPTGNRGCVGSRRGSLRGSVARLDRATGLPLMSSARTLVRLARRATGRAPIPGSAADDEVILPDGPEMSCAALHRLERLDPDREARRRRELLVEVGAALDSLDVESFADRFGPLSVPYGIPFRATAETATAVARLVRRYHVHVMSWPDLPSAVAIDAPAHYRNCWIVNFI